MRLYIHKNSTNYKEYATRLLDKLLVKWLVDDPGLADAVLVSMCDIGEIGDIAKAKAHGRPVIAGGMISEYPVVNELADYVWHGEVYGFRDCLQSGLALDDMPGMTCRGSRRLVIDQRIRWADNPIVRVGGRAMYYYASKGCPVRCKYCLIGNIRDYQIVPRRLYNRALKTCGKALMPIAAYNPYGVPDQANIGETLLRKYIAGDVARGAKMIRSGVEFVTPGLSAGLAKGVTLDDVNEALARSARERTKMILYFIAGLESQEQLEDYLSGIAIDYNTTPAVSLVFTYIDPQPFTPFHDFDLRRKITGIDTKRLYAVASQRNKRIRVLPLAGPQKSTIRTLLGRVTTVDEYRLVWRMRNKSYEDIMAACGLECPHLLGSAAVEEIVARPRARIVPEYWGAAEYIGGPGDDVIGEAAA